jgi:hypothetical protein
VSSPGRNVRPIRALDAENVEEVRRDVESAHPLGLVSPERQVRQTAVAIRTREVPRDAGKDDVALAPADDVAGRDFRLRPPEERILLPDLDQAVRLAIRQRLEQHPRKRR